MLTLSLFLSAVAGVNAILGGEVAGVKIAENKWFCADDCTYRGAYFEQTGFFCAEKDRVVIMKPDDTINTAFPFGGCAGVPRRFAYLERAPRNGDELASPCEIKGKEFDCLENRIINGNPKIIEWSEVEKQLKAAQAQDGQGSPKKPVGCTAEASKAYSKCQNEPNPSFEKCKALGDEAAEKCLKKQ